MLYEIIISTMLHMFPYNNDPFSKRICQELHRKGHEAYSLTIACSPLPEPECPPKKKVIK